MKKILLLFLSILCISMQKVNSSEDFNQIQSPYIGTWHYQNGNELFIVTIWQVNNNNLAGHYKKITVNSNGEETSEIYNSKKYYGNGIYREFSLLGSTDATYGLTGIIKDNTISGYGYDKSGNLVMKIISGTNPLTAYWKVSPTKGLKSSDEPENFSIPTNVVLT